MRWHKIQGLYEGFRDLFQEVIIFQEFIGIMDDVNGALIIAELYSRLEELRSYQNTLGRRWTTCMRSFKAISTGFSRKKAVLEVVEDATNRH